MSLCRSFHSRFIAPKRTLIIKDTILNLLPQDEIYESWLDVGARDGKITQAIYESAKGKVTGMQTLDIADTSHPIFKHSVYDGQTMPFADGGFYIVSFIDVLHHAYDITHLLAEAKRITKKYIVIKDHKYEKKWELYSLKFQDWFGNIHHRCPLPYNFLKYREWQNIFDDLKLKNLRFTDSVSFNHPFPFNIIYPNYLQFVCLLTK